MPGENGLDAEAEPAHYRTLLDAGSEALVAVDAAGMITEVKTAMGSFTSRTKEELPGLEVLPLTAGPDHARHDLEGESVPARDISELRRAKRELEITHKRLRAHLDGSPVAVIEWDADLRITGWSAGAERIFGWSAQEAVGRFIGKDLKLIYEEDESEVVEALDRLLRGEGSVGHKNYNYRKDGAIIECEWYNSVLFEEDGRASSVMSIALDVTRRENLEKKLRHLADHDPLTNLLNRRAFDERLESAIERSSARNHGATAILYMDLDGFKEINDRYGHAVGDELLREVGGRISSVLRAKDALARLGGDEFAVILEGLAEGPAGEREAEDAAERILRALKEPFPVAGRWLPVSASTGVALGRRGESAADLVRRADSRMYREKLDKSALPPPS